MLSFLRKCSSQQVLLTNWFVSNLFESPVEKNFVLTTYTETLERYVNK